MKVSDENKIKAFELWTYRRILRISYLEKRIYRFISEMLNTNEVLAQTVNQKKLRYFGHFKRSGDTLERSILEGKAERAKSKEKQKTTDEQRKSWTNLSPNAASKRISYRS